MRPCLLLLLLPVCAAAAGPREILRDALYNFQHDQMAALRYNHIETDDTKGKGVEVSHLTVIHGTPYERILSRNGEALRGDDERREEEKYQRVQRERAAESPEQRERRIRKYRESTKLLMEASDAFNVTMLGEEKVAGRPSYVMHLTPKPGYHPENFKVRLFMGVEAKLWVDKQDLRIAKAEGSVIDTIALGWIMARIGKGGRLALQQTRLPDGVWAMKEYLIDGTARIMLVDRKKIEQTVTFSGYQPTYQPNGHHASAKVAERASN